MYGNRLTGDLFVVASAVAGSSQGPISISSAGNFLAQGPLHFFCSQINTFLYQSQRKKCELGSERLIVLFLSFSFDKHHLNPRVAAAAAALSDGFRGSMALCNVKRVTTA